MPAVTGGQRYLAARRRDRLARRKAGGAYRDGHGRRNGLMAGDNVRRGRGNGSSGGAGKNNRKSEDAEGEFHLSLAPDWKMELQLKVSVNSLLPGIVT